MSMDKDRLQEIAAQPITYDVNLAFDPLARQAQADWLAYLKGRDSITKNGVTRDVKTGRFKARKTDQQHRNGLFDGSLHESSRSKTGLVSLARLAREAKEQGDKTAFLNLQDDILDRVIEAAGRNGWSEAQAGGILDRLSKIIDGDQQRGPRTGEFAQGIQEEGPTRVGPTMNVSEDASGEPFHDPQWVLVSVDEGPGSGTDDGDGAEDLQRDAAATDALGADPSGGDGGSLPHDPEWALVPVVDGGSDDKAVDKDDGEAPRIRLLVDDVREVVEEELGRRDKESLSGVKDDLIELIENAVERDGWTSEVDSLKDLLDKVTDALKSDDHGAGDAGTPGEVDSGVIDVTVDASTGHATGGSPSDSASDDDVWISREIAGVGIIRELVSRGDADGALLGRGWEAGAGSAGGDDGEAALHDLDIDTLIREADPVFYKEYKVARKKYVIAHASARNAGLGSLIDRIPGTSA